MSDDRKVSEKPIRFRELEVGQWFDFIGPDSRYNSFYERCQKVSVKKYRWKNPIRCSQSPSEWLETKVGTINCEVYNVEPMKTEECLFCGDTTSNFVPGSTVDGCEDLQDRLVPLCNECEKDSNDEVNVEPVGEQ